MTASEWDTLKKVLKEYNLDSNVFTASELPLCANRVWYVKLAYESVIVKEYFTFTRENIAAIGHIISCFKQRTNSCPFTVYK